MTKSILSNSTALALCLSLIVPGALVAQEKRICADGSNPPCAAVDQQAALNDVAATINSGATPTEAQIDSLNFEAMLLLSQELSAELGLGLSDLAGLQEEELRARIKAALGVQPTVAEITPEPSPEVAADADVTVEPAPEVAPEVAADAEPTLSQGEVVMVEETPAPDVAPAPEPVPEPAPEVVEAVPAPAPDPVVPGPGLIIDTDVDAMSRGELLQLVADLELPITAPDTMPDPELRRAVKVALGLSMPTEEPPVVAVAPDAPPAAAAALEAGDADAGEVEITTETLTENDVRSSSEEFETDVVVPELGGDDVARQNLDDDDDKKSGLNNAETAAVLGLGVLALSQILGGNDEVVSNSGDRVVVRRDGELEVFRDDDVLLRQPGTQVETRRFDDGSTRTTVTRDNGVQVITVRAADGTVLRRVRVLPDGTRVVIFDDTAKEADPVDVTILPERDRSVPVTTQSDSAALESALNAELAVDIDRRFTLRQVRSIQQVRHLMPEVTLDAINFRTDSSVIVASEAEELADLGRQMADFIAANPDEIFLVEGHTDTVGSAVYNLALSDRRAESVALALVEYFDVPPENLVIQGYGESDLLVRREGDIRENRRATVRRITPLLRRTAGGLQ